MTVFLCGFMGCGKSTIGKLTAKKLGCGFCDTDELIVKSQGMSIPEIFEKKGEPYFRETEAQTVKSLCGKPLVVACGGGAMLNPDTADAVKKNGGKIIFIDVPFNDCYERIKGDSNRPIVMSSTKEQLEERFRQRYGIYLKNSTVRIECTGSPVENAELIVNTVKNR